MGCSSSLACRFGAQMMALRAFSDQLNCFPFLRLLKCRPDQWMEVPTQDGFNHAGSVSLSCTGRLRIRTTSAKTELRTVGSIDAWDSPYGSVE